MQVVAKMTSQKSLPNTGIACYSYAPDGTGSALGIRICVVRAIFFMPEKICEGSKSLSDKSLRSFLQSAPSGEIQSW
jgi:hypothetical protein